MLSLAELRRTDYIYQLLALELEIRDDACFLFIFLESTACETQAQVALGGARDGSVWRLRCRQSPLRRTKQPVWARWTTGGWRKRPSILLHSREARLPRESKALWDWSVRVCLSDLN